MAFSSDETSIFAIVPSVDAPDFFAQIFGPIHYKSFARPESIVAKIKR